MLGVTWFVIARSTTFVIARSTTAMTVRSMSSMADRYPRAEELASWREFLRAHARLTRQMETDLVHEQRLSLASYDVLVQLAEAPGRRLRMTDLAEALLLSRSGVTRLVGRLEHIGLVTRCRAVDDGRGVVAELTDRGLDRLRTASATHLAGIARHFAGRLTPVQLARLREICETLAGPAVSPSRPAETHQADPACADPVCSDPDCADPGCSDPTRKDPGRSDPAQPVPASPVP